MSATHLSASQHNCSCGRSFLNGISLERHQWVTNHQPAAAVEPFRDQACQAALAQALRVIQEKQAVQQRFDQKRRQRRRLRRRLLRVDQVIQNLVESAFDNALGLCKSALLAGRIALLVGIISGLVATGMKIGTYFPG